MGLLSGYPTPVYVVDATHPILAGAAQPVYVVNYADFSESGAGVTNHALLNNLSFSASGHTGFEVAGTAASAVSTHVGLADPHTQYLKEADYVAGISDHAALDNLAYVDSGHTGFEAEGVADAALLVHVGLADPHTQYQLESGLGSAAFVATSAFDAAGTASSAISTHVGLADPHTQYQLESGYTAADVLSKLLTVDGSGSLLDADLLDGNSSAAFETAGAASSAISTHVGLADPHTQYQLESGLGSAAFLNVGTGASQIVQMTAATKLPAVDGSLLTNVVAPVVGSTTQVIFNNAGVMGGDAGLTYVAATDKLSVVGGVITPLLYPAANSTTAFQVTQADGTTGVIVVDTTNKRVRIGSGIAPTVALDVTGDITFSGTLTGVIDADTLQGNASAYFLPATSYTAADVLNKLLTVDGAGSLLDADLLDGNSSAAFATSGHNHSATYIDVTGDTMTGDLLFGTGAQIDFFDEVGDKVYWYSNTFGTGIETATLTSWSPTNHRWRTGGADVTAGTQRMLLDATGLKIGAGSPTVALDVTGAMLISGDITLGTTAQIQFNDTTEDKIYYYQNIHGVGIEGGTVTQWGQLQHRWRIGGTSATTGVQHMILDGTGLQIGATSGVAAERLDVTGNIKATGTVTASSDADSTHILGRVKFYSQITDQATFAHFDRANTTDYALTHTAAGITALNAAATQDIFFRIADTSTMKMNEVGLRIGSMVDPTVALDVTGAVLISTTLGVTGAATLSSTLGVSGITTVTVSDAVTGTVTNVGLLRHNSTGTAGVGFGIGVSAQLESDTTDNQDVGRMTWEWVTATHASRAGRGKLSAFYTTTERFPIQWEANSTVTLLGFHGTAPVVKPAAYTQTYATATRTHSNITAVTPSVYAAGNNGYSTGAKASEVHAAVIAHQTDIANIKQVLNQVIDDLQAYGLLQ